MHTIHIQIVLNIALYSLPIDRWYSSTSRNHRRITSYWNSQMIQK